MRVRWTRRVDAGASRGVHRGPRFEPQCGAELISTLRRAGNAPRSSAARCIDRTRWRGSRHGVGGHPCSGGRAHRGGTSMRSTEHVSGSGGGPAAERRGRSAAQQLRDGCGAAGNSAVGPDGGSVPAEDRSPPRGGRAAGRLGKTPRAVWHPSGRPTKAFLARRAVARNAEGKRALCWRTCFPAVNRAGIRPFHVSRTSYSFPFYGTVCTGTQVKMSGPDMEMSGSDIASYSIGHELL